MSEKQVRSVVSVVVPRNYGEGDNRKFILVRDEDSKWCPPGGRIDWKDYDVLAAATREVKEETGLCVVLDGFLGVQTFESPHGNLVINVLFSAIAESGSLLDLAT
ncbi:MAG: NUDIX domain-containing protein [Nanoarchaeota archaeon]|nr:NUDIX domain-containing protein [Nanoarchaeota archaeon]